MNDPFVVEQARLWSKRVLGDNDLKPAGRIGEIYLSILGREPTAAELGDALAFLQQQEDSYKAAGDDLPSAQQVWADLCHVLFNVKEFVFVN
jgi:hypothetical protein